MSNEQDKKTNPNPEELEELNDGSLEAVAGGKKGAPDPYAGYPDNLREGLAPSVVSAVEAIGRQCIAEGMDRVDCSHYVRDFKYHELSCMNEAAGFEYMIDFYYLNMVLDRVYGIG